MATEPQTYTMLAPLPQIEKDGSMSMEETVTVEEYIKYAFNLLVALAAVAAVFMIVLGGFQYMTSSIPGVKTDGKKKIQNALLGLLLVLCSYIILRTINPRLVEIPKTLVPDIELTCPSDRNKKITDPGCRTNSSTIFFDNIAEREREQIRQTNQGAVTRIEEIDEEIEVLEDELEQYKQSYRESNGYEVDTSTDPEAQEIIAQINESRGEQYLIYSTQSIDNQMISTDTAVQTVDTINQAIQACRDTEETYKEQLTALGQTEKVKQLEIESNFTQTKLAMLAQLAAVRRANDPTFWGGVIEDTTHIIVATTPLLGNIQRVASAFRSPSGQEGAKNAAAGNVADILYASRNKLPQEKYNELTTYANEITKGIQDVKAP